MPGRLVHRKLIWTAGLLAAAGLPLAHPLSAQYVTHPAPGYGVVTQTVTSPDGKVQPAEASAKRMNSPVDPSVDPTRVAGCPVAMHAQRRMAGATMLARDGGKPVVGQRIYLEIERGRYSAIEAQVTVHGTRAQARLSPALSTSDINRGADAARSFTLKPGQQDAASIASDLAIAGFTSVVSISLDSVTYADGRQWKTAAGHSCIIEPDPLMLVSSR